MAVYTSQPIYIVGAGAIGFPLAVQLAAAGRAVIAVRTSRPDTPRSTISVTVQHADQQVSAPITSIGLNHLEQLRGMIVVTSKSYANSAIAQALAEKRADGPIVVMQNGIAVEQPFIAAGLTPIYRCMLYITGQARDATTFQAYAISASPIGIVSGDAAGLAACVAELHTEAFPFRAEAHIQREIWRKTIINTVFNAICPLVDADNGIFARDAELAHLARAVVRECVSLTDRLDLDLSESELMAQVMRISSGTAGQVCSTLQDIRAGRPTEIDALNGALSRVAAAQNPPLELPQVRLLGTLLDAKARPAARSA